MIYKFNKLFLTMLCLGFLTNAVSAVQLSSGSIIVATTNGTLSTPSTFFWDWTNAKLGVGTNTPTATLDVSGKAIVDNSSAGGPSVGVAGGNGDRLVIWRGGAGAYPYSTGINSNEWWFNTPAGTAPGVKYAFYVNASRLVTINISGMDVGGTVSANSFVGSYTGSGAGLTGITNTNLTAGSFSNITGVGTLGSLTISGQLTGATATFSSTVSANAFYGPTIGVNNGSSASAGYIGEYFVTSNSTLTNVPTTGQYGDMGSLTLTAGDWDLSLVVVFFANGATFTTQEIAIAAIGTAAGNDSTGSVLGDTRIVTELTGAGVGTGRQLNFCISNARKSISSTTVYYAKIACDAYSVATPQYTYRFSARRVR